MCFQPHRRRSCGMPDANLHFPKADTRGLSRDVGRRRPLRGDARRAGRREALGLQRSAAAHGQIQAEPPPPAEYRKLATRVVELHPMTIAQNARTSGGGNISMVPTKAITVGPVETWKAEKVSIWHAGTARQSLRPAADGVDDLEAHRRHVACRCRCWRIIRTCSSTTTAAASALRGGDALRAEGEQVSSK